VGGQAINQGARGAAGEIIQQILLDPLLGVLAEGAGLIGQLMNSLFSLFGVANTAAQMARGAAATQPLPRATPASRGAAGATGPQDPNQKVGPTGFGDSRYVSPADSLSYRVDFENESAASVPAQRVVITDRLDADLDWSQFELAGLGFGDQVIEVSANSQHFETTLPFTYAGTDFDVQIEARIRLDTGVVYATFQAIDSATGLPPPGSIGFLPPEDGTGRGQGYLTYLVRPKADLTTGTEIRNVAEIVFNFNPAIGTNFVDPHDPSKGTDPAKEALVTIDAEPPISQVAPLPPMAPGTQFLVQWSGQDDAGGSGIRSYDVFVSSDGGAYSPWIQSTSDTSRTYSGAVKHTYAFYSLATDNVGHREAAPAAPDASTTVPPARWQNPDWAYDVNDDRETTALDALIVINYINAHPGGAALPAPPAAPPPYYDVNGDDVCTPKDVLIVINYINSRPATAGEGEATEDDAATGLTEPSSGVGVPSHNAEAVARLAVTTTESSTLAGRVQHVNRLTPEGPVVGDAEYREVGMVRGLEEWIARGAAPEDQFDWSASLAAGLDGVLEELARDVDPIWNGRTS
jgi:hypothetical protein